MDFILSIENCSPLHLHQVYKEEQWPKTIAPFIYEFSATNSSCLSLYLFLSKKNSWNFVKLIR